MNIPKFINFTAQINLVFFQFRFFSNSSRGLQLCFVPAWLEVEMGQVPKGQRQIPSSQQVSMEKIFRESASGTAQFIEAPRLHLGQVVGRMSKTGNAPNLHIQTQLGTDTLIQIQEGEGLLC